MSLPSIASLWARVQAGKRGDFMVLPAARNSYADLERAVRRWLHRFDSAGLAQGERIVIRTDHEFAAASCFIAALLDGIVPVLLTADTPDIRLQAVLRAVEPGCLVVDEGHAPAGAMTGVQTVTLGARQSAKRSWFERRKASDSLPGLEREAAGREPHLPPDDAGLAYILFTSGTTSSPSGVMVSRGNLFANLATLSRLFGYDAGSRIFNDMILAHADGMIQGPLLALANGCAVIRSGGFTLPEMEAWLNRVRLERATHVITVPTIWAMIDAYARHDDYFDARECRALLSVAAKLPEGLWERLESRFRRPVFNQYGLTETVASALYAGPAAEMGAFGTIGRPADCEARIEPASADGLEGELQLRGPNVFPGYWRDADRTHATFTQDGWMRTGDLARARDDGSYEILGRLKTVIMMGGFLIRPDEIDEAMLGHPAVRESVTVGVEDEFFGEVPLTAVVCSEAVDENELTAHARARLESQKVPKRIVAVASIPRGDAGKPRIAAVRDMLLGAAGLHSKSADTGAGLEAAVLTVAADVFRVESSVLSAQSRAGDVPGWDSFSQLSFLLAVEQEFGIAIPASRVAAIQSIDDMVRTIGELQA